MFKSAADIMQPATIQVEPETRLVDITRLFVEEEISGAPVVDETGRLLGVISATDILRALNQEHESPSADPHYFRDLLEFSAPDWVNTTEDFQDRLEELTVSDVMQTSVVTVDESTSLPDIAKLLRSNRIHRVLVVRGEFLIGIISTFDLIAVVEALVS